MKTQNPPMTLSYKLILTLFSAAFAASLIACFFRFPATAGGIEGVAVWLLYLLYMMIAVVRQANRLIIRTLLVLMTANVALAAVLLIYLALRPAANPCPLVLGPLGLLTLAADFTFHICLYKFFSFHEALRNGKREI